MAGGLTETIEHWTAKRGSALVLSILPGQMPVQDAA